MKFVRKRSAAGDKKVCQYLGELFPEKFPYTDEMWDNYAKGRLMAKAFDVNDFEAAKKYGKECKGVGRIKRICSQNSVLFGMYRLMKKIRGKK